MLVRLKGIKTYRSKGKVYHYHRATGTRIVSEPGTAAFVEEVRRLDEKALQVADRPGTLGGLMAAYRASPEFARLSDTTKADYREVMDYLQPLADVALARIDSPFVLKLRDKTFAKRKRRFANYVLAVLSILHNWGTPRGITTGNPAEKVPKVERPRKEAEANRAWKAIELETVMLAAPDELRVPIALAAFAGLRQGDVIRLPWTAYKGGVIESRQAKTGDPIWVPVHSELRALLDAARDRLPTLAEKLSAKGKPIPTTIVIGQRGESFTEDGFRARFFKLVRELETKEWVWPGLTFHGLRHTAATMLADAGCDTRDIQAVLGHRTAAMSEHYAKEADRKRRASAAITKLERARNSGGGDGV
ncbi:tyrosine-type recombinase/integrase [Azospirillum tabaci]|uniref:tyrosine-type recombinase/integrase n=1 Tax=Azospirillum tabaci TaxID=2752310 RepID=UPI00166091D7|nr:tyrosine-type recombinase/integrase [Azospirillum tabaci]